MQGDLHDTDSNKERVFLVGVGPATSNHLGTQYSLLESLEELANLADAAGLEVPLICKYSVETVWHLRSTVRL